MKLCWLGRGAGIPSCSWHCTRWISNLFHPPGHIVYVLKLPAAGHARSTCFSEVLGSIFPLLFVHLSLAYLYFCKRKWKYKATVKFFSLYRYIQTSRHTSIRLGNILEWAFSKNFKIMLHVSVFLGVCFMFSGTDRNQGWCAKTHLSVEQSIWQYNWPPGGAFAHLKTPPVLCTGGNVTILKNQKPLTIFTAFVCNDNMFHIVKTSQVF